MMDSDQEPGEETPAHETSVRRVIARELAGVRRHAGAIANALRRLTLTVAVLYACSVVWLALLWYLAGRH